MRALLSVFDKDGIIEFAKELVELNYELISSGGTYQALKKENVPVIAVEDVTLFPECLDGRVKTLHPHIHAGILANRRISQHMETLKEMDIDAIDLVVCNLYPFKSVISNPNHNIEEAVENIDIGGPSMIRAAAKNYDAVSVITDKADYSDFLENTRKNQLTKEYRFQLAKKAFTHTAQYDMMIANYFNTLDDVLFPDDVLLSLHKKQSLRYGENPHQKAAYYTDTNSLCETSVACAQLLHGKELSYNNINDAQGAIDLMLEFDKPTCVAVKHSTPCGVATADTAWDAYQNAYDCDPVSIFGGIVCINQEIDEAVAQKMHEIFLEVIIAPSYSEKALEILTQKKNIRLLKLSSLVQLDASTQNSTTYKGMAGGFLMQENDNGAFDIEKMKTVTKTLPTQAQIDDMIFAMKVVKHVKSNAIVVVKNNTTLGIGGGEVSRIWAAEAALARADLKAQDAVVASDAFFPFSDVVNLCAQYGIKAIIQPGGSMRDDESIQACNKSDITMIFTGQRHFRH